jgi:hypothetical protein
MHGVDGAGLSFILSSQNTSETYHAAGDGAICAALPHLASYDGDSHLCDARHRHQGCAHVEWYEPRTVIRVHDWLLEPHLHLAQGKSSYRRARIYIY